jgi:hypothetical protein
MASSLLPREREGLWQYRRLVLNHNAHIQAKRELRQDDGPRNLRSVTEQSDWTDDSAVVGCSFIDVDDERIADIDDGLDCSSKCDGLFLVK